MPVNKSVMNRHRDRHHQFAFPYDGFSGIQQRVVIAASLLLCAGDGSKIQVGTRLDTGSWPKSWYSRDKSLCL